MIPKKKKVSVWLFLLGCIPCGYLGYLINGAWKPGIEFTTFLNTFQTVCEQPLQNYWNERSVKAILIALMVYGIVFLLYVTSQRNYMHGREFGTARFESPKVVNSVLMDENPSYNRILSQNLRMSMDFRKLKLNGNVLICGGSGSGKTFYEVKPNLLQMPNKNSFIVTDPKGGARRSRLKRVSTAQI